MSQTAHTTPSPTSALVQLAIATLLGLVLLPTLLGQGFGIGQGTGGTPEPLSAVWLAVAIVLVVWLFVVGERLTRFLDARLSQSLAFRVRAGSETPTTKVPETRLFVSLVLVIGYALLGEAILRQPLAAVLGVYVEPTQVDAIVATVVLVLVLALLIGLYRTARPLIKAAAWYALDGVLATSGSDRVQRFYEADDTRAAITAVAAGAPRLSDATVASGEPTRLASDATIARTGLSQVDDAEATRVAPPEDLAATQMAPSNGVDATQLAPTDDNTLFQRKPPANPRSG